MNNLLIAIAVFVITVVGALIAVPYFIDWNSYRAAFEEEARNVIGRDVQVDGDVKLYLLPTPYLRVEKVRIAETSSTLSEYFFKTDSLSIKLSVAPLLRGVIEANDIELQRPVLRLAVDAKGGWNWQGFAKALSSAGYMPANVTLNSVKVVDGTLVFHGPDGVERARLEGVNGELSAPALAGPYRIRGRYTSEGAVREVSIGTGVPEADGKVPFRAALRLLDTGASFTLDARAVDLMGKARIEGDLVAHLPVPTSARSGGAARILPGANDDAPTDSETPLEVKAALKADVAGAALSDLTLTFEQGERPQTVTGTARVAWLTPVSIELKLASRWLDLDRLAGSTDGTGSVVGASKLAAWIRDLLPSEAVTRLNVSVDQANLAGESVGPMRLALTRSGGKLSVSDLRTALPGGSRGSVKGEIAGSGEALGFRGSVGLGGTSAARFLSWATGNALKMAPEADGSFDVHADVAVDASQAVVRDLTGTMAATALKGSGRYKWTGRPELVVSLAGPKLDARGLLPTDLSLFDMYGVLMGADNTNPEAKPGTNPGDGRSGAAGNTVRRAFQSDLDLQVKAGQLITSARTYRDFATAVTVKAGNLRQLLVRLSGDDGYNLQLEGKVDNLAAVPKGTVHGLVVAENADSIGPLAALLGVPAGLRPGDSREQALVPLRLAGTLTFGRRAATSADWTIDGEGNGAAIKINARFDGSTGGWRSGHADLTASVDSADPAKLATLLFPGSEPSARTGTAKPEPGRILVRASGVPSQGLTTLASVDVADTALNFRGKVRIGDGGTTAAGDLEAHAANGSTLAALAGLPPSLRADGVPVSARLKLAVDGDTVGMDNLSLQLGSSRLVGKISLSTADDRRRINATLATDEIGVATLLGPLLDRRFGAAGAAEAALFGQSPWPDEPFSGAVLDAFEGRVRLSCRRLVLAEGMALERAKVDVVLTPGKIEAKEITGSALGGQVKAAVSIDKAPAGADMRGSLSFGIAMDQIAGPRPPRASGPLNGTLQFSGRGMSPRAVMSALQGTGSIAFGAGKLPGLAPAAVSAAAEAALKADADKIAPVLRQALVEGLATRELALAPASFALEVADGQVRGKALALGTAEGRAIGSVRLDLKTLKLDAQWRLEAKTQEAGTPAKPLPAVIVSYRAPLAALSGAEQQIDTTALEQEVSARKIEQGMQEVERLRRLNDAERKPPAPAAPAQPPLPAPAAPILPAPAAPVLPAPPIEVRPEASTPG